MESPWHTMYVPWAACRLALALPFSRVPLLPPCSCGCLMERYEANYVAKHERRRGMRIHKRSTAREV